MVAASVTGCVDELLVVEMVEDSSDVLKVEERELVVVATIDVIVKV